MNLTPEQRAAVLSLAEVIGEAIARAHLSGKQAETRNANAPAEEDRGVRDFVPLTKEETVHEDYNT